MIPEYYRKLVFGIVAGAVVLVVDPVVADDGAAGVAIARPTNVEGVVNTSPVVFCLGCDEDYIGPQLSHRFPLFGPPWPHACGWHGCHWGWSPNSCDWWHFSCAEGEDFASAEEFSRFVDKAHVAFLESSGAEIQKLLAEHPAVLVFNTDRKSVQIKGCGGRVIANYGLSEAQVTFLTE